METYNVVIIGSGPAGNTAAIYAGRASLQPVLYQGFFSGVTGGQLMMTTEVENYPGFPKGIMGPELIESFIEQAKRFETRFVRDDVIEVDLKQYPFLVVGTNSKCKARALIIATGATAKRLDIPGTRNGELWQKGVSACAVCDGAIPIFRNKKLYVIGGGDSAAEEAIFLTRYASKVYLVHRRDQLKASKVMAERVLQHPKIEVLWNSAPIEVKGKHIVESIVLENSLTHERRELEAGGVFFAIGHTPNTAFLQNQLELQATGYIKVVPGTTKTSVEGVFAAGDVQDPVYRQVITSAASGCMAALEAERYLTEKKDG